MSSRAPTILFVDGRGESQALAEALRGEGFLVRAASTGTEALQLAREDPHLVVLDLQPSDMTGTEVCRRLKNDPITAATPVLHLSPHAPAAGADGYLTLPADPHELVSQVKALLRLRQAEKALGDSEALYHSLVESLPVSILRKDVRGHFTFANRAFCQGLGHPPEEVVGKTDLDFYPETLARKYTTDDRRVMETGEVFADVEENVDREGARTYVEVVKSPLRDALGLVIGVQVVFWDVTARKRAETELGRQAAEFRVARCIQQRLFPAAPPRIPGLDVGGASYGFDVGGASFPAEAIGGDYFDYLGLPDGSLGVAIGDVSGHGIGPALLMAEARALLRAFAQTEADVSRVLALVNRTLTPDVEGDRFITLLLARLDPNMGTLTYASAGHTTGYVFDSRGDVKQALESTAIPLGVLPQGNFAGSGPLPLAPGDLVLLLTDGVVEARDPDGTTFGPGRTAEVLRQHRHEAARHIVDHLYQAVRVFAQHQPQFDDITATVIKVAPT
jgi:sigma-B regulation protein RsbU (phosphoserine phosphatase)